MDQRYYCEALTFRKLLMYTSFTKEGVNEL